MSCAVTANTLSPARTTARTARAGRPLFKRCHVTPPSCETATPRACVPAYTVPSLATAIVPTAPGTERIDEQPLPDGDHVMPPSLETRTPADVAASMPVLERVRS